MSNSQRSALPGGRSTIRRATGSSRASRSFLVARISSGLNFSLPPRGSGAPRGRWCGSPHPGAPPFPSRTRGGNEGAPEHLCEGVPRASDVGARALAALHRGVLRSPTRCFISEASCEVASGWGDQVPPAGAAPRSASDAFRKTPLVSRDGWEQRPFLRPLSTTKVSLFRKIGRRTSWQAGSRSSASGWPCTSTKCCMATLAQRPASLWHGRWRRSATRLRGGTRQ
jgi:hypothetical protein